MDKTAFVKPSSLTPSFVAVLCSFLFSSGPILAQTKDYALKMDLDPVVALPSLFELTPEALEQKLPKGNFSENPYVQWEKEGKDQARILHKPYSNITVELSLFGGKVPVEEAIVDFRNGKVSCLTVVVSSPEGEVKIDTLETPRAVCAAALNTMLAAQPTPRSRYFGGKAERLLRTQVWSGAAGIGCLDFSSESKFLRFALAPASEDVANLVSGPIPELIKDGSELFCNLDSLFATPAVWMLTPEKLEAFFADSGFKEPPYFKWLSSAKESARFARHPFTNVSVDLSLFDGKVPVDEAVIEFKNGKVSQINASLYNRGDSGKITKENFEERYKAAGVSLNQTLGVKPVERRPTATTAIKTSGWFWTAPTGLALLEYNADAMVKPNAAEFMRLKLSPPEGKNQLLNVAAIGRDSTGLKRSELLKFVKKEKNGDIYVGSVPMVDQGDKGYCVVASAQRMFGYLHIACDQHEIAALAGTDAQRGTNSRMMEETLKKIDTKFKTRFKPLLLKYPGRASADKATRPDHFLKMIQDHVDKGVPLLWGLELGLHPEVPELKIQGTGGHMRLIIGYNVAQNELLFTDSWGAGHELKRMKLEHAIDSTFGVYLLEPRDFY